MSLLLLALTIVGSLACWTLILILGLEAVKGGRGEVHRALESLFIVYLR